MFYCKNIGHFKANFGLNCDLDSNFEKPGPERDFPYKFAIEKCIIWVYLYS